MRKALLGLFALLMAMALTPAHAADKGTAGTPAHHVIERIFSEAEKAIIEEYMGGKPAKKAGKNKKHKKGLPPGLAKKDQLPPGLAMQLEKNGRLPPGLAKRDLPDDLLARLPSCKKKGACSIVGDDIVLVDAVTQTILDIIKATAKK